MQIKDGIIYISELPLLHKKIEDFDFKDSTTERVFSQYIETQSNGQEYKILSLSSAGPRNNTPVYVVPEGKYFVLGDNRDFSHDSRDQEEVGFVPKENIIGKALRPINKGNWLIP